MPDAESVANEIISALPDQNQDEVLYALGMFHVVCKEATSPESVVISQRVLDACLNEAASRGIPTEIVKVVQAQAEVGKFVVG